MKECFENEIAWIHSQDIQQFAKYCVDNLPDYFFTVPASSSGKYHPSYALGEAVLFVTLKLRWRLRMNCLILKCSKSNSQRMNGI